MPPPPPTPLLADARAHGIAEVMVPRLILTAPSLPLLATGKIDFTSAQALVRQQLEAQSISTSEILA